MFVARAALARIGRMTVTSSSSAGGRGWLGGSLRLLRPEQWVKNLLLFLPLLLSHHPNDLERLPALILAFVLFSFCASAGYILNDLHDRQADRYHPTKRRRPLASGQVPVALAGALMAGLLIAAFGMALVWLPRAFTAVMAIYLFFTTAYSLWLKSRLLLDVFVLAGLYTLRLQAGGAATGIELTPWLLAFSMFIFLSLAFAKRYTELTLAPGDDAEHLKARNYRAEDAASILSVGPASGYLAVLVMAIYISSDLARQQYRHPRWIWLACPVLLYWITRIWFLARRRELNEDPIAFALTDWVSWAAGLVTAGLILLAAVWP